MSNDKFETLETERLILRKLDINDALMLFNNVYSDFEWYKYYIQLSFSSLEVCKLLLSKYKLLYDKGNYFRWGIVERKVNQIIGEIHLHSLDALNNNCKIAYIIGSQYSRQGYAYEAVQRVLEFAFDVLDYHRIEADIVEENEDSIKLAERLGMNLESIKYDSYKLHDKYYNQRVYSLVKK